MTEILMRTDPPARLVPLDGEAMTEEASVFLAKWTGDKFKDADKNPVLRTFARNPELADAFSTFNVHVLVASSLPLKLRQLAIMRTAWQTGAVYMWSSHLNFSLARDLPAAMFGPLQVGPEDPYFDEAERVVLRATDELVRDRKVSDATWPALNVLLDDKQVLDLLFLVGCYVMLAGAMRSLGIERTPDLIALAERHGAPTA
jgi:4-carboxymuconolactone decarboxylase